MIYELFCHFPLANLKGLLIYQRHWSRAKQFPVLSIILFGVPLVVEIRTGVQALLGSPVKEEIFTSTHSKLPLTFQTGKNAIRQMFGIRTEIGVSDQIEMRQEQAVSRKVSLKFPFQLGFLLDNGHPRGDWQVYNIKQNPPCHPFVYVRRQSKVVFFILRGRDSRRKRHFEK